MINPFHGLGRLARNARDHKQGAQDDLSKILSFAPISFATLAEFQANEKLTFVTGPYGLFVGDQVFIEGRWTEVVDSGGDLQNQSGLNVSFVSSAVAATIVPTLTDPVPADGTVEFLKLDAGLQVHEVVAGAWVLRGWLVSSTFDTVTDFFASTDTFTAGTIVRTREEGFAYKAVASGGHVTNAGGQEFLTFASNITFAFDIDDLRLVSGVSAGDWAYVQVLDRYYKWSETADFDHSDVALDIVRPTSIADSDPGRWLLQDTQGIHSNNISLPNIGIKLRDLSVDQDARILLMCDSLGAPHTTIPAGETLKKWWVRQTGGTEVATLDRLDTTSALGGTLDSAVTASEDENVSLTGVYYALGAGTYRWRSVGSNPFATGVRIPYIREPGAGSFTIHLEAIDTGEIETLAVDADGVLSSQMAELTLPNEVTGRISGQRFYVDIEVTSGTVKFLPYVDCLDSTVVVTKLHYNTQLSEGGHNFNPAAFESRPEVLSKQIVDYDPDLIIVQVFDQVEQHRGLWELLLPYFKANGFVPDVLFVATQPVFEEGEAYGDSVTIDGEEVSRRKIVKTFYKAMCELNANCQFYDFGSVIRSQEFSEAAGFTTSSDRTHPSSPDGAAYFASEFAKAVGDFRASTGPAYLPTILAPEIIFGAAGGRSIDSRQTTGSLSYNLGGDARLNMWRAFEVYENDTGSPVRKFKVQDLYVAPGSDNAISAGMPSLRYSVVYAGTGTINTSDEREKQDIRSISGAEGRVAKKLKSCIRAYRWKDAVEKKGHKARVHFGSIAQEVIAAFRSEGLDPMQYGIVCYDEWDEEPAEFDDDGQKITNGFPAGDRYGVRYDEMLAFMISAM